MIKIFQACICLCCSILILNLSQPLLAKTLFTSEQCSEQCSEQRLSEQRLEATRAINISFQKFNPKLSRYITLYYSYLIVNEANYYGVNPYVIAAIAITESSLDYKAKSKVGAIGLCQIMPFWIDILNIEKESNLYIPLININASVRIFKKYLGKAKGDIFLALSFYNAGQKKWLKGTGYARKVMSMTKIIEGGWNK